MLVDRSEVFKTVFFNVKVAERVAAERAEVCGNGKSTGYQIRLERYTFLFYT